MKNNKYIFTPTQLGTIAQAYVQYLQQDRQDRQDLPSLTEAGNSMARRVALKSKKSISPEELEPHLRFSL